MAVNTNRPLGASTPATLRMSCSCAAGRRRNTSPHAITPSNVRPKNVDVSTGSQATCTAGNRLRIAATMLGDAPTA